MSRWCKLSTVDGDPCVEYLGMRFMYWEKFYPALKKLAELEDLEEQGRLIELPCKVGDTVWKISTEQDNYDEPPYKIVAPIIFRIDCLNAMGKNIFPTKEEAEATLIEE